MKKVLITGGTGFVGSYLTTALLAQTAPVEIHVTSLTVLNGQEIPANVELHVLDLSDKIAVNELLKEVKPDEIYQLASLASVPLSFDKPRFVLEQNFLLVLNMLEAMREFCPQSKMLLISSADIYYKDEKSLAIDEKTPLVALNPYAASKMAQDFMAQSYVKSFGQNIVIARPFNHIGAGQQLGSVVPDFAKQIAEAKLDPNKRTIKVGNLDAKRDFSSVKDIVRAYVTLMEKGTTGEIYNIGSGKPVSIQYILDELIKLSKVDIKVEVDPSKIRPVDVPVVKCDNSKIEKLGWQPQVPLEESLKETLDYWEKRVIE